MRFSIIKNKADTLPPEQGYVFQPPGGTIGRSIDNNLILPDEDRIISRLQAIVHVNNDGSCYIVNKGTITKLYLNGSSLIKDKRYQVKSGDIIGIAGYTIRVSHPHEQINPDEITAFSNEEYQNPPFDPEEMDTVNYKPNSDTVSPLSNLQRYEPFLSKPNNTENTAISSTLSTANNPSFPDNDKEEVTMPDSNMTNHSDNTKAKGGSKSTNSTAQSSNNDIPEEIWDSILNEFAAYTNNHRGNNKPQPSPSTNVNELDQVIAQSQYSDPLHQLNQNNTVDLQTIQRQNADISSLFGAQHSDEQGIFQDQTPTLLNTPSQQDSKAISAIFEQAQPLSTTLHAEIIQPTPLQSQNTSENPNIDPLVIFEQAEQRANLQSMQVQPKHLASANNQSQDPLDLLFGSNLVPPANVKTNDLFRSETSSTSVELDLLKEASSLTSALASEQQFSNNELIHSDFQSAPQQINNMTQPASTPLSESLISDLNINDMLSTEVSAEGQNDQTVAQSNKSLLETYSASQINLDVLSFSSNDLFSSLNNSSNSASSPAISDQQDNQQPLFQQEDTTIFDNMIRQQSTEDSDPFDSLLKQAEPISANSSLFGLEKPIDSSSEPLGRPHDTTYAATAAIQKSHPFSTEKVVTQPIMRQSQQSTESTHTDMSWKSTTKRKTSRGTNIDPTGTNDSTVADNDEILNDTMLDALLSGMGLTTMVPKPTIDAQTLQMLGKLISRFSQGTVALLSSRSILKNNMNANNTMIFEEDNNPFKILPTGQTVLMQMLSTTKLPGFLPPEQAVREALIDLQAHQLGMIAGLRAIIAAMMQLFNPDRLETEAHQQNLIRSLGLPNHKKAILWDLFVKKHQTTLDEIDDNFDAHFGEAFMHAYDIEVNQYKDSQIKPE